MQRIFKLCQKIILGVLLVVGTIVTSNTYTKVEAAEYVSKVQEYRAAWVSHFAGDISRYSNETQYKTMLNGVLDNMQSLGMNAMVFHVRTHNNALYDSDLNPLASWWSGVNFEEFDPLEWLIEECHNRGIEFHAWLNPYRVSSDYSGDLDDLAKTFPSNNIASSSSNYLSNGKGVILDPGLPEVRNFIVETCMELIERYEVDAIHFDDYFYISDVDDSGTRTKYNTNNLSIDNFRRKQVDLFIEQLSNSIRSYNTSHNRAVQLGISPSGIYRNGSFSSSTTPSYNADGDLTYPLYSNTTGFAHYGNYLYSDTKKWIDEEWIDYITPQAYWALSHNGSNFSQLTKWWSWCTRYKDVNLYMGQGIYMILDKNGSGAYWQTENEIFNQFLDMQKYPEIDGGCMYKYASMLSSNSLMQIAVNNIKSCWNKKIPAAYVPSLAYLQEPKVENIALDGDTISWSKCDDVRGYIVWQVPVNEQLDKTDFDQLYIYTQDLSVKIEDGFDYYVSSVNRANEISDGVLVDGIGVNSEKVIEAINAITLPITLESETKINNVRAMYDRLDIVEQGKVTNYDKLLTYENTLNKVKALSEIANQIEEACDKHITTQYILPSSYGDYQITWEYKNSSDSAYYDIVTGQRLKKPLATTNITLLMKIERNEDTFQKEVTFNVGYVASDKTGIFYRNDPGVMSRDDVAISTGSYIGFSGYSLEYDNYVYFIATGNYIELDSTTVPNYNWSSCARVYKNISSTSLSITASNLKLNTTSGYGYFIVGTDGIVRKSENIANATDIITLASGEILYSAQYLDSQINGSPMKPASNVEVGKKVIIVNHDEIEEPLTNQQLADNIIALINAIPNPVTLDSESLINRANSAYIIASQDVKDLVTNYAILTSSINELNRLKEAERILNEARNEAILKITKYVNINNYSSASKIIINNYITEATSLINVETSTDKMNTIVSNYQALIDQVKTLEEEQSEQLVIDKADAIEVLEKYIPDLSVYSQDNIDLINTILNDKKVSIQNATTSNEVKTLLEAAKKALGEILTIEEELDKFRNNAINSIKSSYRPGDYSVDGLNKIQTIINLYTEKIYKETETQQITTLSIMAISEIAKVKTKAIELADFENYKAKIKDDINNYQKLSDYSQGNRTYIEGLITDVFAEIDKATITNYKDYIDYLFENYKKTVNEVPIDIELISYKQECISNLEELVDYSKITSVGKTKIDELLQEAKNDIQNGTSRSEVRSIYLKAKQDVEVVYNDNLIPTSPSNCPFGAVYILTMVLGFFSLALVIRKK